MFRPDGDRQRQADARPDRIAAADPVPEAEHPPRLDAEFGDLVEPRRHRGEMVGDRSFAERGDDPGARRLGVGHRLLGGEGLGGDDEQGPRRLEPVQRVGDVGAVDVGDEMAVQARPAERRQRARRHRRTEVGAADADVDDVGHRLAERAAHPPFAHVGGEGEHLVAFGLDRRRDVDAVDQDRRAGKIAQRAVQRRAPLGRIDQFAAEHRVALGGDVGRLGERQQQPQRLAVDPLLGEIVEQVAQNRVEAVVAGRIGGEEIGNRAGEQRGAPRGELGEDDRGRRFGHGLSLSGAALYALRLPRRAEHASMPPQLQLRDIRLTLGGAPLLDGAELSIAPGERIALVGRNGSGKSTLLRIAAGEAIADGGTRFVQPNARLCYLPQEPDLSGHATTLDFVLSGLGEADNAYRARALMDDLGIDPKGDPAKLSGGEARRAAMVRVLAADPDIMLLDEPTNHLDLIAIEWLEKTLAESRAALAVVSHDRRLLADLTRATVWLDRGRTRRLDQGFAAFEAWRDTLLEEEELARHKLDRRIVEEEHWMRYGVTARRKRNMRRVGELATMRRERREARRAEGVATMAAQDTRVVGRVGDRGGEDQQELRRPRRSSRISRPG